MRRQLRSTASSIWKRSSPEVYRLYDKGSNFRSVVYEKTGHEYLPENAREEMARWFEKTLPLKR